MRVPWKLIGLAGVAGVAASGAVVARRRRGQQEYEPDELREKLHERLRQTRDQAGTAPAPGEAPPPSVSRRLRRPLRRSRSLPWPSPRSWWSGRRGRRGS